MHESIKAFYFLFPLETKNIKVHCYKVEKEKCNYFCCKLEKCVSEK